MIATDVFGPHTEIVHVSSRIFADLWDIYVQNVDPVMKILHIPTAQPHLLDAAKNSQPASDTTMALLYAVCFAATATISKEEALAQFGHDRLSLLRHFMYRMDQSLMKAKFLIYPDLQTIQSLVIYLVIQSNHYKGSFKLMDTDGFAYPRHWKTRLGSRRDGNPVSRIPRHSSGRVPSRPEPFRDGDEVQAMVAVVRPGILRARRLRIRLHHP